jgi:hypothetical protein
MSFNADSVVERRDMTHIRPLPGALVEPKIQAMGSKVPFGQTIHRMQVSGFHCWGFVIVRATSYDYDHQLWESFLTRIRTEAECSMTRQPPFHSQPEIEEAAALLLPLLRWDVLEDQDSLQDARVEGAIRPFLTWQNGTSIERDGQGANSLSVRLASMPRFRYFVMVDNESLASLEKTDNYIWNLGRPPPIKVRVVDAGKPQGIEHLYGSLEVHGGKSVEAEAQVVVVEDGGKNEQEYDDDGDHDGDHDGDEDDYSDDDEKDMRDEHEPIDGNTDWDVGWMWVEASLLLSLYGILQGDGWDDFYVRPLRVYGRS